MNKRIGYRILVVTVAIVLLLFGITAWRESVGSDIPADCAALNRPPRIQPDYTEIVIPPNIAPLNFTVDESAVEYRLRIHGDKGEDILIGSRGPGIVIPERLWRELLHNNRGGRIVLDLYAKDENGRWSRFNSIENAVAREEIDSHLVYRLIGPLCNQYFNIGIYQRNLENYDESPVLTNESFGGCVNCHSFLNNRPDLFSLQTRPEAKKKIESGAIVVRNGHAERIKTQSKFSPKQSSNIVWHPNGSVIGFSMTTTRQFFHGAGLETREAYDTESHMAIMNVDSGDVSTSPDISDPGYLENFPCWSVDGKSLYYCNAKQLWEKDQPPTFEDLNKIKFDLMRVDYDIETNSWGQPKVVLAASETGMSICEPKASPNGRYILVCMLDHGSFPLFRSNADLYLWEIESGKYRRLECNSDRSEAWHCWSSNSRWIVFSSRRDNDLLARPYFSHIDKDGNASKPFVLPQKNPAFYDTWLKTYNVPELITGPITVSQKELLRAVYSKSPATDEPPKAEPKNDAYMGAQ